MRALAILLLLCAPAVVRAQPTALIVVENGASEAASRRWRARAERALSESPIELSIWARERAPAGTIAPARLEVLSLIETLLIRARHSTARLREQEAMTMLARAEALAEQHLDIPGMAHWYAEIELAIAITASQVGLHTLSATALRRATSVDSQRSVQAAEARPDLVERARTAQTAAASGPTGRFRVESDAPGAVAFLDDRRAGALPRELEAPVGPHVLRIDAPGHRSWAGVIEVHEGDRLPVIVALNELEELGEARAVEAAARAGDVDAVAAGLARLEGAPLVWLIQPGPGPRERALLTACTAEGCGAPQRFEEAPTVLRADAAGEGSLAEGERWLMAQATTRTQPSLLERWETWLVVGLALAVGASAAAIIAIETQGPAAPNRTTWVFDFGDLTAP